MARLKRYVLKINSSAKIEELLQELYNEACNNINEVQEQINRLQHSVELNKENMEAKTRYAKAMNDFISSKDKAIGRKLEIAKVMSEICKYNGNVTKAMENEEIARLSSLDDIKKMLAEEDENQPKRCEYKL